MAYREMYEMEVKHKGLHKYRLIRGTDQYVVEQKAQAQVKTWDEMWKKKQDAQQKALDKYASKQRAEFLTKEAQFALNRIENTLKFTLNINDAVDWEKLKDFSKFTKPAPELKLLTIPDEPKQSDIKYKVNLIMSKIFIIGAIGVFCLLLPNESKWLAGAIVLPAILYFASQITRKIAPKSGSYISSVILGIIFQSFSTIFSGLCILIAIIAFPLRKNEINKKANEFKKDQENWLKEKKHIEQKNEQIKEKHKKDLIKWEEGKQSFYNNQKQQNLSIEERKKAYLNKDQDAILDYCDIVLANSIYPDNFPQEYDLDYSSENKILIVEYSLPPIESLSTVKEVKYIASKNELKKSYLTESVLQKIYDSLLYQISLRTMH